MQHYQFLCPQHAKWISEHPQEAFSKALELQEIGEKMIAKQEHHKAIVFFGTAFETAELIFDNQHESPQLTTRLASLTILLANTYGATKDAHAAKLVLTRISQKMTEAIRKAENYDAKAAFYSHCIQAIKEARREISGFDIPIKGNLTLLH